VIDAGDERLEPEVRCEAYGWLTNGGLTWACSWLDLDRDLVLSDLEGAGLLAAPAAIQLAMF